MLGTGSLRKLLLLAQAAVIRSGISSLRGKSGQLGYTFWSLQLFRRLALTRSPLRFTVDMVLVRVGLQTHFRFNLAGRMIVYDSSYSMTPNQGLVDLLARWHIPYHCAICRFAPSSCLLLCPILLQLDGDILQSLFVAVLMSYAKLPQIAF